MKSTELEQILGRCRKSTPVMMAVTIGDVEYEVEVDAATMMFDKTGEDALWLIGTYKEEAKNE